MRVLLLLLASTFAFGQVNDFSPQSPAFAPVVDDAALPRVLLIGDSISIGYTVPVRKALAGKANVHRIPENGADTINGLKKIDSWLGDSHWDVIHFNWGLHDLKVTPDGGRQVPVETYEKNLAVLVERLKATGAQLIWATTTPVPEGKQNPPRDPSDPPLYTAAARGVMESHGVIIDDLYAAAMPRLAEIQLPVNVHFNSAGWELLGSRVAAAIGAALNAKQR
jgi:lysophospholipase L1-like esterase